MKTRPPKPILVLTLAICSLPSAQAFVPSVGLGAITPGESHAALTKTAIQMAYDDLGITKITKSMKNARTTIIDANASVDKDYEATTARHCDAENLSGCNGIINAELADVVAKIKADNAEDARKALGRAFHTLQDFYSHSNWIELGHASVHPEIGSPGSVSNVAPTGTSTCIEAPAGCRASRRT